MGEEIVAVLFDAVGTLIYADPPVVDVYQAAAARFGSRRTRDEIGERFRQVLASPLEAAESCDSLVRPATSETLEHDRWKRIVSEVIDDLPPVADEHLFAELWQHFSLPKNWRLFDDVAAVWHGLQQRGFTLGITSNFDSRLRSVLAGLPPLDAFEKGGRELSRPAADPIAIRSNATTPAPLELLFISSEIGYPKPAPQFFEAVQTQLRLEPSQILIVGDDWTNDIVGGRAAGWHAVWLNRSAEMEGSHHIAALTELLSLLPQRIGTREASRRARDHFSDDGDPPRV